MRNKLTIRKAAGTDSESIIEFNIAMAMETENKTLRRDEIEPGVTGLFQKPEYGFYMVAEAEAKVVGTLMITKEWSDWRNGLFWWIQSVYVLPGFRRRGVYRSMYQRIRELAVNNPEVCGCRLYVEKENTTAQKTYTSLGMNETHYKMYEELLKA